MAGDANNKRRLPANIDDLEGARIEIGFDFSKPSICKGRAEKNRGFSVPNRKDRIQNRDSIN